MQKPENCLQIESEMRAHFNKTYATFAQDPVLVLEGAVERSSWSRRIACQ